jgi:SAM-dependent methyltransferase
VTSPRREQPDHERHNREFWDADADDYQAEHGIGLERHPRAWGVWRVPEDDVQALGPTHGLDVLELGCGAAQWSAALATEGARVVAFDQSHRQLQHARTTTARHAVSIPLVCGSAEATPFADESFDLVMCDHGAMSFCDPEHSVGEAARVLRTEGRLVFSHTTPWPYLAWNFARDRVGRRLRRSYFGMRRFDDGHGDGTVDFQLPYGEWIRCFGRHGLVVEDLVELRAPKGASTTFASFDARWARRWPAEQLWVTRKRASPSTPGT